MFKHIITGAFVGAIALSAMSVSAEMPNEKLKNFTATGETESCIRTNEIKNSRIIDAKTILFQMRGNDYYVNNLPQRCPSLVMDRGFAFENRGSQTLCNSNSITTKTSFCMLGRFERVEKIKS